jgi:hypothetical protein
MEKTRCTAHNRKEIEEKENPFIPCAGQNCCIEMQYITSLHNNLCHDSDDMQNNYIYLHP